MPDEPIDENTISEDSEDTKVEVKVTPTNKPEIKPQTTIPAVNNLEPTPSAPVKKSSKKPVLILVLLVVVLLAIGGWWWFKYHNKKTTPPATQPQASVQKPKTETGSVTSLELDPNKNYGNKYANGILPVGDSKYVTAAAKQGYVYSCKANYDSNAGGAGTRGPWFTNNNTQYDLNKKVSVSGSVSWTPKMTVVIKDGKRIVTTNDLPTHKTGVYPVASSDPAYKYDRNPNSIKDQGSLEYALTASPTAGTPQCMGGETGVMLTGVALFNAFDAGGRDAGAWEVQDGCDGHPQVSGEYHYHTLSRCITDQSVKTVIGYALDGFPITGPKVGDNNILTTSDLDECHGLTSTIKIDGKDVKTYHYVMTQDFPYSVSCFRATAVKPPGQQTEPPKRP